MGGRASSRACVDIVCVQSGYRRLFYGRQERLFYVLFSSGFTLSVVQEKNWMVIIVFGIGICHQAIGMAVLSALSFFHVATGGGVGNKLSNIRIRIWHAPLPIGHYQQSYGVLSVYHLARCGEYSGAYFLMPCVKKASDRPYAFICVWIVSFALLVFRAVPKQQPSGIYFFNLLG